MKLAGLSSFGVALLLASSTASADVRVTMQDGRVSVVAKDATLRQILTEWARVGETRIVNLDKIPGGPISLELTDVPEQQALDVLLRSLAGYMAAPRTQVAANLSIFDRIIVMPTLVSARPAASNAPPPPVAQQPQAMPPPADTQIAEPPPADTQIAEPAASAPAQNPANPRAPYYQPPRDVSPPAVADQRPPGFSTPVGFVSPPNQPVTMPGAFYGSGAPAGVAVPGMIVQQPPRQPGQTAGDQSAVPPHVPGLEIAPQPGRFPAPR